jgi:ABC-type polysaccharide/polyol phosphate export permease
MAPVDETLAGGPTALEAARSRAVILPAASSERGSLGELLGFRQLIVLLVQRELKVRYKRSLLGLLWTMLNPLLQMIVYNVVFTTIMAQGIPDFSIFLLGGLLPWIYFSNSLMQGTAAVLGNQELIRKIRIPQAVFPIAVAGSNLVNFTLSFVPLLLVMLAIGHPITGAVLFMPVSALILTAFVAGTTLLISSLTVFFRDVRHLTEVVLQIFFYLSPILYTPGQFSANPGARTWWRPLFDAELRLNPISSLVPLVREPVYYGRLPDAATLAAAVAWSLGALVVGYLVFRRLEKRHIHHF